MMSSTDQPLLTASGRDAYVHPTGADPDDDDHADNPGPDDPSGAGGVAESGPAFPLMH